MWSNLLQLVLAFVVARLKEPSTWQGIIGMLTAAGIQIAPEWQTWILTTGLSINGGIKIVTPDRPKAAPR